MCLGRDDGQRRWDAGIEVPHPERIVRPALISAASPRQVPQRMQNPHRRRSKMVVFRLLLPIVLLGASALAEAAGSGPAVVESARKLPVAGEVDVVVAGGSTAAVAAAVAAAEHGASVLLAAPRPYLGEDLCATLRLDRRRRRCRSRRNWTRRCWRRRCGTCWPAMRPTCCATPRASRPASRSPTGRAPGRARQGDHRRDRSGVGCAAGRRSRPALARRPADLRARRDRAGRVEEGRTGAAAACSCRCPTGTLFPSPRPSRRPATRPMSRDSIGRPSRCSACRPIRSCAAPAAAAWKEGQPPALDHFRPDGLRPLVRAERLRRRAAGRGRQAARTGRADRSRPPAGPRRPRKRPGRRRRRAACDLPGIPTHETVRTSRRAGGPRRLAADRQAAARRSRPRPAACPCWASTTWWSWAAARPARAPPSAPRARAPRRWWSSTRRHWAARARWARSRGPITAFHRLHQGSAVSRQGAQRRVQDGVVSPRDPQGRRRDLVRRARLRGAGRARSRAGRGRGHAGRTRGRAGPVRDRRHGQRRRGLRRRRRGGLRRRRGRHCHPRRGPAHRGRSPRAP